MKTWVFVFIAARIFMEGLEEFFILPTAWYYIKSLGQTKTFLGLVMSVYSISAILTTPLIGIFADRFGNIKCIIIFCYSLKIIGNLLYSIPLSAYFPLIGRLVSGCSFGSNGVYYGQIVLYTPERYRAKVFIFLDGIFCMGTVLGPTFSSILTFDVEILGWRIDAGNSPGVILAMLWLISMVVAFWLPSELEKEQTERSSIPRGNKQLSEHLDSSELDPERRSFRTIACLLYLIFLSLFYSSIVAFYTPLLAQEHFHLPFVHVKLLFLTSSLFAFALLLSLYIVAEHFDERTVLVSLTLVQILPIALLTYFAITWDNPLANQTYLLIIYNSLGVQSFSFSFGCSLLSKVTETKDAAFYQSLSLAALHVAYIASRVFSSWIFTKTSLLLYCLGLTLSWALGALWFGLEYKKFIQPGDN